MTRDPPSPPPQEYEGHEPDQIRRRIRWALTVVASAATMAALDWFAARWTTVARAPVLAPYVAPSWVELQERRGPLGVAWNARARPAGPVTSPPAARR